MRAGRVILIGLLLLPCGCKRKVSDPGVALHRAVGRADRAQILSLLADGADINTRDRYGATPLHGAAIVGHKRMVDLLIAHGADVDTNDAYHGTPLHCAIQYAHLGVVRSLVAAGADVNSRGSHYQATPLERACAWRNMEMAGLLLSAGANPNVRDRWGGTVLHHVASEGSVGLAKLVLNHGAEVNAQDMEGLTPLHEAVWKNQFEMVRLLLAHGADINSADLYGKSPAHVAAQNGYTELLELLFMAGADVSLKDDQGQTPTGYARLSVAPAMIVLRADAKSPYSVIITNSSTIREFLRGQRIPYDRLWSPRREDVESLDLKTAITSSAHIDTKTWFDRDYILFHLQGYNQEYAGFIKEGRRYLLCNMDLDEPDRRPLDGRFSMAYDGGCALARVVIDLADKTVVRIDCNGN